MTGDRKNPFDPQPPPHRREGVRERHVLLAGPLDRSTPAAPCRQALPLHRPGRRADPRRGPHRLDRSTRDPADGAQRHVLRRRGRVQRLAGEVQGPRAAREARRCLYHKIHRRRGRRGAPWSRWSRSRRRRRSVASQLWSRACSRSATRSSAWSRMRSSSRRARSLVRTRLRVGRSTSSPWSPCRAASHLFSSSISYG